MTLKLVVGYLLVCKIIIYASICGTFKRILNKFMYLNIKPLLQIAKKTFVYYVFTLHHPLLTYCKFAFFTKLLQNNLNIIL